MKENNLKQNPAATGIIGAAVGATIGVTAMLLSNKGTREKVTKKTTDAAADIKKNLSSLLSNVKRNATNELARLRSKGEKNIEIKSKKKPVRKLRETTAKKPAKSS